MKKMIVAMTLVAGSIAITGCQPPEEEGVEEIETASPDNAQEGSESEATEDQEDADQEDTGDSSAPDEQSGVVDRSL